MNDANFRVKALAEDPDLEKLSQWGQAREAGREDAHNLEKTANVKRIRNDTANHDNMTQEEIDEMIETLQVVKLSDEAGRYSNRNKGSNLCNRCTTEHQTGRCPANGKMCFTCGGKNHFSLAPACPGKKTVKKIRSDYFTTLTKDDSPAPETIAPQAIKKVATQADKWVNVKTELTLFADTGSEHTIIAPNHYTNTMGPLEEPGIILRAWGSSDNLHIKGMLRTVIENAKGTKINSKIYVVDGFQPEPLLGDKDAEQLRFITFNKNGKSPKPSDAIKRIPQLVRENLGIKVDTHPEDTDTDPLELEKIEKLVGRYKGLVFDDNKIGDVLTPNPFTSTMKKTSHPSNHLFTTFPYTTKAKLASF